MSGEMGEDALDLLERIVLVLVTVAAAAWVVIGWSL